MLKESFKFVKYGINSRIIDPTTTQVHIHKNRIITTDGRILMVHPFNSPKQFSVDSDKIIHAAEYCDSFKISTKIVTLTGKHITVKLPYKDSVYEEPAALEGKQHKINTEVWKRLKVLANFISDDASREWSQTVLIKKKTAYVTNNIILARSKVKLPDMQLPFSMLSIILKLKEKPLYVVVNKNFVQFIYGENKYIASVNPALEWPDVTSVFKNVKKATTVPIGKEFATKLMDIRRFVEMDTIHITPKGFITPTCKISYKSKINLVCSYACLVKIVSVFKEADFKAYPKPMAIKGPDIDGVFVGFYNNN